MGVPLVTITGDRFTGRMSASFLAHLGLNELVAETVDQYIEIATHLAGDPERLATLRAGLRPRMAASPLCDAVSFARDLEAAYRGMWRRWCAGDGPQGQRPSPSVP